MISGSMEWLVEFFCFLILEQKKERKFSDTTWLVWQDIDIKN